jgi:hypothetical protein
MNTQAKALVEAFYQEGGREEVRKGVRKRSGGSTDRG